MLKRHLPCMLIETPWTYHVCLSRDVEAIRHSFPFGAAHILRNYKAGIKFTCSLSDSTQERIIAFLSGRPPSPPPAGTGKLSSQASRKKCCATLRPRIFRILDLHGPMMSDSEVPLATFWGQDTIWSKSNFSQSLFDQDSTHDERHVVVCPTIAMFHVYA